MKISSPPNKTRKKYEYKSYILGLQEDSSFKFYSFIYNSIEVLVFFFPKNESPDRYSSNFQTEDHIVHYQLQLCEMLK